jgi:hypothetical protein
MFLAPVSPIGVPSKMSISVTKLKPKLALPRHVTSIAGCSNRLVGA